MTSEKYWRERFSILESSSHQKAQKTIAEIEGYYRGAMQTVQRDIESWYSRFATNNQISLSDARKWLAAGELKEFQWTVDQYIKAGQQAGLDEEWLKKLENASAKFHISRLEAIQMQIQQQIELLNSKQTSSMDTLLRDVAGDSYLHAAYEVQLGTGLGWDITGLDQKVLDSLISKPWSTDGRTFRDRCWVNKNDLVNSVTKNLTQGLLRGDSSQKIIEAVQKQFGVSRYKAGRLVNTETTYFNAVASKQCYKDLNVEMVEIIETLDSHTCPICGGLDGKTIPMAQYEPGVTVPPFHPNCRGTTAPAIDAKYIGERAARNADGDIYYVPADMTYNDWKKNFVANDPDYMGRGAKFDLKGKAIKAYAVDGHSGFYTQTNSTNAQNTIQFIEDSKKTVSELDNVSEVVVAKDIPGVAAYDHVANRLYVNEKLSNADYIKGHVANGYFAAETAEDVLKHEMYHKKHWDNISQKALQTGKSADIIKTELESGLRKYVKGQKAIQFSYVKRVVSRNAERAFNDDASLNELIADVLLLDDKGINSDPVLTKLARRCLK